MISLVQTPPQRKSFVVPLNTNLEENAYRPRTTPEQLAQQVRGRIMADGKEWSDSKVGPELVSIRDFPEDAHSIQPSFLYAMSDAYSYHRKFSIAPHDLWYVLLTEVARTINAEPNKYASIFTKDPTAKKCIIVHQTEGDDYLPLGSVMDELRSLVPVPVDLFIPKFSTHTLQSETACLAAFADAVKSFYNYMTFCCGIHSLEIRGSETDWELFVDHAISLRTAFRPFDTPLVDYLSKIINRALLISSSLSGDASTEFYQTIFSSERIGSGGELNVDGWFPTEFFMMKGKGPHKIDNYPNTWSVVPFHSLATKTDYITTYGAFHTTTNDQGFIESGYSNFTFRQPK